MAMPKFVAWGRYCENVLERRSPHREAHLTRLQTLKENGALIALGPTEDLSRFFGIYAAADAAAARTLIEEDPYWQHGIWIDYELWPWIQAF